MPALFAAVAFLVATTLLFGDPLRAVFLATDWSNRLGIPHWRLIAVACIVVIALAFRSRVVRRIPKSLRGAAFVVLALLLPTALIGLVADTIRHRAVVAFQPDEVEEHLMFASLRQAPQEYQFFLHTAVLKSCVPYAWSYRTMGFYVLNPNVAVNVLPLRWVSRCRIERVAPSSVPAGPSRLRPPTTGP